VTSGHRDDVDAGLVAGEDEDRHAVVVVAAPAARRLEGPRPATTAPVAMNSSTIWPLTCPTADGSRSTSPSVMTTRAGGGPPSPSPLPGPSLGPAMNPSRDIDM
jgi:hypothetical protein